MGCLGLGPQGMVLFGTFSSQGNTSLPGFEELALPLLDSLYSFARRLVHNQHDIEDLVQDTYLKALSNFTSFQPGTNFRAWIFQILKNTFLSSCSRLERRMTVAMDSEADSPMFPVTSRTPESVLIERSGIDAIRCAIEQLPVIFREVILLRDVEDASYQEIAEILSIPIGTVMSRLARARKAVRESLRSTSGAPVPRNSSHNTDARESGTAAPCVNEQRGLAGSWNSTDSPAGFGDLQVGETGIQRRSMLGLPMAAKTPSEVSYEDRLRVFKK